MGAKVDRGVSRQGQLIWAHERPAKGPSRSPLANALVLPLARNLVVKSTKEDK